MIEDRVDVREGDILIIHTGYHHFGPAPSPADEIRYMAYGAPRPRPRARRVGQGQKAALDRRRLRRRRPSDACTWAALACRQDRAAQVNTIIRNWMVAFVDDAEYDELTTVPEAKWRGMPRKAALPRTRLGDGYSSEHVERIERLARRF